MRVLLSHLFKRKFIQEDRINNRMGAVTKTSLDLADGKEIKLSRFEADSAVHEGDGVFVSWDPARSVAIKAEEVQQ